MATESSSYAMELAHQRRMVVLLAGLMLLFTVGVRFDRAFFMEDPQAKAPSSAFAALVPPPTVFAGEAPRGGAPARRVRRRAIERPGVPDAPGSSPAGELFPAGAPIIGAPSTETAIVPAAAPVQIAAAAPNSQFGNPGRSLFGIPGGVIFGTPGGGSGTDPITPGTPGAVPEPESWMLMFLGVGMIGAMMRARGAALRRKRLGRVVAA